MWQYIEAVGRDTCMHAHVANDLRGHTQTYIQYIHMKSYGHVWVFCFPLILSVGLDFCSFFLSISSVCLPLVFLSPLLFWFLFHKTLFSLHVSFSVLLYAEVIHVRIKEVLDFFFWQRNVTVSQIDVKIQKMMKTCSFAQHSPSYITELLP